MPNVNHFINHASTQGLASYFSATDGFQNVDWSQDHSRVAAQIIALFYRQPPAIRTRIEQDLERITHMSDEIGQAAILSTCLDSADLRIHESAVERSLSVFQTDRGKFLQAEDIRYADHCRHGHRWSGYQIARALAFRSDPVSIETFKVNITSLFGLGDRVKIDYFECIQSGEGGTDNPVVQVMVYQEGLPDVFLEFTDDEHIAPCVRRPVAEHAITYDPASGTLDVVAATQERRDAIAKAFIETLLKQPLHTNTVPLRRYDLKPLMNRPVLDWDADDQIESVQLIMLKLRDLNKQGRVSVEVPAKSGMVFHEYCSEHFGECNPVASKTFIPVQAIINIRFQPELHSSRGKVLPVNISLPNGCDLRSRTERERKIGEKYLKRWGLMKILNA